MTDILVDENTRWKCMLCGKCCRTIGQGLKNSKISLDPRRDKCSKLNIKNMCEDYFRRPVICKMYPFHPSREDLALGKIDFRIGKLIIDSNCPGFGQGMKILKNKSLMEDLKKVALLLEHRISLIKKGKIIDAFF